MAPEPEDDGFDTIAYKIIDNLEERNERLEVANEHYREGFPLAGERLVEIVGRAKAQHRSLADLVENPSYSHPDKIVEELYRTERNLKKVDCYLSIGFEEVDQAT